MSDERPARPEYGEYASPEDQAAASGVQPHWEPPAVAGGAPEPERAAPRRWDVVLTVLLVAIGAYTTINSVGAYLDLPGTFQRLYDAYGYTGTFPATDLARPIGVVLAIVEPVALVLAVALSARQMRRGRVTFWIPLTIGAVATILASVLLVVVLWQDPGFVQFLGTPPAVTTPTPQG